MMTLEEAIKHCKDVALSCTNKECALEHFQLLKWLQEYNSMLEKQGEQKLAWSEEDNNMLKWVIGYLNNKMLNSPISEERTACKNAIAWFEKLKDEKKPTDKVEPKFKVGDWLVHKDLVGVTCCITQIHAPHYYLTNNNSFIKFGEEDNYRPWTIQDAKDGDVLFYRENVNYSDGIKFDRILLFENLDKSFFVLTKYSNGVEDYGIDVNIDYPNNTVPATKEQKEILFMAMKDAGYTFDFEKKELRKIKHDVQLTEFEYALEDMMNTYRDAIGDNDVTIEEVKERAAYMLSLINPKSAWSEEDEIFVNGLIRGLSAKRDIHGHTTFSSDCIDITETINWLKSLKNRVGCEANFTTTKEWSEEEEVMIKVFDSIIRYIVEVVDKDALERFGTNREELFSWLKSLKDRTLQQPKQEWSEEDGKILNSLISSLARIGASTRTDSTSINYTFSKEIDWLKSLKPQNKWKPNDEQMLAINTAINVLGKGTLNGKQLIELREELQKLREE